MDLKNSAKIKNNPKLKWLNLELLKVKKDDLSLLTNFSKIEILSLKSCVYLNDHDLEPLKQL